MIHSPIPTRAAQQVEHNTSDEPSTSGANIARPISPVYVSPAEYIAEHSELPDHFRTVSVGGGPASTAKESAFIDALHAKKDDLNGLIKLGGNIHIDSYILEKESAEYIARGMAWGPNQGYGTANTKPEKAENHEARLETLYKDNREQFDADYREHAPVAAVTFNRSFAAPEGTNDKPSLGRAAITRRDLGVEEQNHFNAKANAAKQALPFYHLHIMAESDVQSIDITDPDNPAVLVKPKGANAATWLKTNSVELNIGTPLRNPITNPNVKELTFCEAMDPAAVRKFAEKHDLLGADGLLKEGKKLGTGGTSLSQYDQLIGLNSIMKFMTVSEDGKKYDLLPDAKAKYAGALVVISNTPGKWVPPRFTNVAAWTQEKDMLGTAEELHAMQLHQDGHEIYRDWRELSVASVALTLKMDPEKVTQSGMTTVGLLRDQDLSTKFYEAKLEEAAGLSGPERDQALKEADWNLQTARRQQTLTTMLGTGIDPEMAPLTMAGRHGYMYERAQAHAVTAPEGAATRNNREEMAVLGEMTNDVIASPHNVHKLALELIDAGIMTYRAGSYEDMTADKGDKQISFKGRDPEAKTETTEKLDAFFVSPTFSAESSSALTSLHKATQPIVPEVPNSSAVGANRMLVTKEGGLAQVQDFSVARTGVRHPVTKGTVGNAAYDTNNRDSTYQVAEGQAELRSTKVVLKSAGLDHAGAVVDLYKKHGSVSREEFDAEVAQFAEHFTSAKDKAAFVKSMRAALIATPDLREKGDLFANKTDQFARTAEGRTAAALIGQQYDRNPDSFTDPRQKVFAQAMSAFNKERGADGKNLEKFNPTSMEAYYNRSIDFPLAVHKAVYADALQQAKTALQARGRSNTSARSRVLPRAPQAPAETTTVNAVITPIPVRPSRALHRVAGVNRLRNPANPDSES